jgi:hypothetical protein
MPQTPRAVRVRCRVQGKVVPAETLFLGQHARPNTDFLNPAMLAGRLKDELTQGGGLHLRF